MKKTYVPLAALLSSLMGVAHAQSSVTVFGFLDLNISSIDTGAAANSRITQMNPNSTSTSNIGFKGIEDLGGGMAAMFDLQSTLSPDTGAAGGNALTGTNAPVASFFTLASWVGLRGDFGTVMLGRTGLTPNAYALLNAGSIIGPNTGLVTATAPQGINNDYYASNSVQFISPLLNGFSFRGHYSFGEVAGGNSKGSGMSGMIDYSHGPFRATLGAQRDTDSAGRHVTWSEATASYRTEKYKITSGYTRVNNSNPPVVAGGAVWRDSRMWTIGGSYLVAPQLGLAAQYSNLKENVTGTSSKQVILNANYFLSKRTTLYGLLVRSDNGAAPMGTIGGAAAASVPNAIATGVAVGIRHAF
jgi:predicted porin